MSDSKGKGGGGAGNPNSLRNLRQGGPPNAGTWREGQVSPNQKHGLRIRKPGPLLKGEALNDIMDALAESVPLRGPDGDVRSEFIPILELAAVKLVRVRRAMGWLTGNEVDERGNWRPENAMLTKEIESLERTLDRLGATPMAFARLGFDVVRTTREQDDLALRWARDGDDG